MNKKIVDIWMDRTDVTLFVKDLLDGKWRQTNLMSRDRPHFLCLDAYKKECLFWLRGGDAEVTTVYDLNWENKYDVGGLSDWSVVCVWMRPGMKFCNPAPSINVNGFKVPAPLYSQLTHREVYYMPDVGNPHFAFATAWTNDHCDYARFHRGLAHATMEAAVAHAKALLYIDPYKKE